MIFNCNPKSLSVKHQILASSVNAASVGSAQDGRVTDRVFKLTYCDAADDGGTHEVAALVPLDLDLSAVEQQLGPLVHAALDQAAHPLLGLGRDQRANICARLVSCKGPKSPASGVTHYGVCKM